MFDFFFFYLFFSFLFNALPRSYGLVTLSTVFFFGGFLGSIFFFFFFSRRLPFSGWNDRGFVAFRTLYEGHVYSNSGSCDYSTYSLGTVFVPSLVSLAWGRRGGGGGYAIYDVPGVLFRGLFGRSCPCEWAGRWVSYYSCIDWSGTKRTAARLCCLRIKQTKKKQEREKSTTTVVCVVRIACIISLDYFALCLVHCCTNSLVVAPNLYYHI